LFTPPTFSDKVWPLSKLELEWSPSELVWILSSFQDHYLKLMGC
jgi:hypothetical protein